MTGIRWKNIIRGIYKSLNRFLSIFFIVALGAGFMAGLAAASPDMYDTADSYIDDYNLYDIDAKSTLGFSETDIEEISSLSWVSEYECGCVMDMVLNQSNGSDFTSRVYGILDENGESKLNNLNLTEGRMPENSSECVIESVFGKYSDENIQIGDVLYLSEGNSNYSTLKGYMESTALTVVGIAKSPMAIGIEGDSTNIGSGTINLNVYTKASLFNMDFYTDIFLTVEGAKELQTFEDAYQDLILSCTDEIEAIGDVRAPYRGEELKDEISSQISEYESLLGTLKELADTEENMSQENQKALLINEEVIGILKANGASSFAEKLESKDSTGAAESSSAQSTYLLAEDLSERLESAKETLESLGDAVWLIRTRDDLAGFASYKSNVGKVSALAKIFPVFFFIVALLVALTTMSRLIEERRTEIGTLKALGFSNWQILFEYLLFSFSASVLGCVLGFAIGFRIFPWAISNAYGMMYFLPETLTPIRWNIIAWVAPVTIISILLATIFSCWNEFRSVPALLMVPKAPSAGKRIWLEHIGPVWRKIPFTYKVTCRNLFRYKKRFIMTIIGVAGCSALLLTGFGIKDSINDIIDKQFGEINKYDLLFVHDGTDINEMDDILEILDDSTKVSSYVLASQETGKVYAGKNKQELTILVPENPGEISKYLLLRDRKSKARIDYPENSVVLTEKLCEELGIKAGDTVTLEDSSGHKAECVVSGIAENYVYSYAYMSSEYYEKCFGQEAVFSTLLCLLPDEADKTALSSEVTNEILKNEHFLYARSLISLKDTFAESIKSINGVVYVLILAAGLLSIVVLYNLTNVNICERKKELASLMVLGFYKKETQNYIFRETNILSFIGSVLGLFVGLWLHSVVVKTVEVNGIMFGRDIKPLSFVLALAISVVFTLLVDLIMKKSISSIDMAQAMKAND